jgi:hypothetical protein
MPRLCAPVCSLYTLCMPCTVYAKACMAVHCMPVCQGRVLYPYTACMLYACLAYSMYTLCMPLYCMPSMLYVCSMRAKYSVCQGRAPAASYAAAVREPRHLSLHRRLGILLRPRLSPGGVHSMYTLAWGRTLYVHSRLTACGTHGPECAGRHFQAGPLRRMRRPANTRVVRVWQGRACACTCARVW